MRACDYVFPPDWEIGDYPGFDTVELRDKIRAEIREETKGMTDVEVREYRRLASERAELRRTARARLQAASAEFCAEEAH